MVLYKHDQLICCYVIKPAGETTKKVMLSVIWNPLLIEINLSQIRPLDIKREKVCIVSAYLLFTYFAISVTVKTENLRISNPRI